jgi:hypothetical protein
MTAARRWVVRQFQRWGRHFCRRPVFRPVFRLESSSLMATRRHQWPSQIQTDPLLNAGYSTNRAKSVFSGPSRDPLDNEQPGDGLFASN